MTDKYAALRPTRDRQCYRADGVPKKRYRRLTARATAARRDGYHAYRCGECRFWHIGRDDSPRNAQDSVTGRALAAQQGRPGVDGPGEIPGASGSHTEPQGERKVNE